MPYGFLHEAQAKQLAALANRRRSTFSSYALRAGQDSLTEEEIAAILAEEAKHLRVTSADSSCSTASDKSDVLNWEEEQITTLAIATNEETAVYIAKLVQALNGYLKARGAMESEAEAKSPTKYYWKLPTGDRRTTYNKCEAANAFKMLLDAKQAILTKAQLDKLVKIYLQLDCELELNKSSLSAKPAKFLAKLANVLSSEADESIPLKSQAEYRQRFEEELSNESFEFDITLHPNLKGSGNFIAISQVAKIYNPFFTITCDILARLTTFFKIKGTVEVGFYNNLSNVIDCYCKQVLQVAISLLRQEKNQNLIDYISILTRVMEIGLALDKQHALSNVKLDFSHFQPIPNLEKFLTTRGQLIEELTSKINYKKPNALVSQVLPWLIELQSKCNPQQAITNLK